jgi:hypothetical protein
MQSIVVYTTEKENVEAVKDWYFGQYPRLGYDTRVASIKDAGDGKVDITFERLASCD